MKLRGKAVAIVMSLGGAGAALCVVGAGLAACSSSSKASGSGDGSAGSGSSGSCSMPNSLTIAFNPMYSAFVPGSNAQMFVVPAVVSGVSQAEVTWSASDPSAVGFMNDSTTGGTLITVLQIPDSGTVTISAAIGTTLCGSAPLTITQNTEADWTAGNSRYNNGAGLINPFAMFMDGGADGAVPMTPPPGGFTVPSPSDPSPLEPTDGGPGPACTNCHGATATGGIFQGIEHTPQQTAGFSDQQLIDIIVNGIIPDGGYFDESIIPYQYWQYFHKWRDLTPEQQTGMVCYLRSLTPAAQTGKVDFGGAFGGDGGGFGQPGGGTPPGTGTDSGADAGTTPPAADGGSTDASDGSPE
jgi:hypothetical protein